MNKIVMLLFCVLSVNALAVDSYRPRSDTDISRELLKDRHFKNGFNVLNPIHGKYVINGQIASDGSPITWSLAQWHSKYDITDAKPEHLPDGGVRYSNPAKSVTLHHNGSDIILGLNSVVEYDGQLRKDGQPWPHLLIEQKITDCPNLLELKRLDFNISAKVLKTKTFKKAGYTKKLHTAHIPFVLVVQNTNPESAGFDDFIWFLVPIYDDRYEFPQKFIEQDIADPSAKMIYDPGGKRYYQRSLHCGEWVNINCDLLPVILEAMNVAWEKGYLKQSKNLRDYHITSMSLGWEVTGLNEVEIAIKDLSLKAVTAK